LSSCALEACSGDPLGACCGLPMGCVIGTKVGWWDKRKGLERQNIIDGCEDSLRRLGVDTIDLYWLHRDDEKTPADEYLGALDALVTGGKVRAVALQGDADAVNALQFRDREVGHGGALVRRKGNQPV